MEDMAENPFAVHTRISDFLGGAGSDVERSVVESFFATPSASSKLDHVPRYEPSIGDTDWTEEQKRIFTRTCGREMVLAGYW
jgi:hypothetical protein